MRVLEIFKGKNGKWFWHAKSSGRIVEDGAQGYTRKWNLRRALAHKLKAVYKLKGK